MLARQVITFVPVPGFQSYDTQLHSTNATVTASAVVTWTYTKPPGVTASLVSGVSGKSITFTAPQHTTGSVSVSCNANGVTNNWTLDFNDGGAV